MFFPGDSQGLALLGSTSVGSQRDLPLFRPPRPWIFPQHSKGIYPEIKGNFFLSFFLGLCSSCRSCEGEGGELGLGIWLCRNPPESARSCPAVPVEAEAFLLFPLPHPQFSRIPFWIDLPNPFLPQKKNCQKKPQNSHVFGSFSGNFWLNSRSIPD